MPKASKGWQTLCPHHVASASATPPILPRVSSDLSRGALEHQTSCLRLRQNEHLKEISMKLRHLALAVALLSLSGSAMLLPVSVAQAAPNAPIAPFPGACGYLPYMTLGSSCIGSQYLVAPAMSYSECKAMLATFVIQAMDNHQCSYGDWTAECVRAIYCIG